MLGDRELKDTQGLPQKLNQCDNHTYTQKIENIWIELLHLQRVAFLMNLLLKYIVPGSLSPLIYVWFLWFLWTLASCFHFVAQHLDG